MYSFHRPWRRRSVLLHELCREWYGNTYWSFLLYYRLCWQTSVTSCPSEPITRNSFFLCLLLGILGTRKMDLHEHPVNCVSFHDFPLRFCLSSSPSDSTDYKRSVLWFLFLYSLLSKSLDLSPGKLRTQPVIRRIRIRI